MSGGCVCPGVCLPNGVSARGVSVQGGVCPGGVCPGAHTSTHEEITVVADGKNIKKTIVYRLNVGFVFQSFT